MYDPVSLGFFGNRGRWAMGLNLSRFCSCGRNSAYPSCRVYLWPREIPVNFFSPECWPGSIANRTMLQDCGWVLEYGVDRARA